MKRLIVMILASLCALTAAGCGDGAASDHKTYEDNALSSGSGWYGDLPNGLRPMVLVNGTLFRWTGMSKEPHTTPSGEVYTQGDASTFLPPGYTAVGVISGITEEVPAQELQLRAAFKASGTVFTSEETPEVVYVLMTTDWFQDFYIRFVSDALHDNESIFYGGREYRISIDREICEVIKELPASCQPVGTLTYIGSDSLPHRDLETNCIADGYSKALHGREVFADPDDSSILYVYEHQYWAQGDYPAWRVCPLWEE